MNKVYENILENSSMSFDEYKKEYELSISDPESFWKEKSKGIDWIKPFEKVKNDIGINGKPIPPFYTLSMIDDPKNLKIRTQNWSKSNFIHSSKNILCLKNLSA